MRLKLRFSKHKCEIECLLLKMNVSLKIMNEEEGLFFFKKKLFKFL